MSDEKKQEITNEGKPKYQPPQVLPLGGLTTGLGGCTVGSTEGSTCQSGPGAGDLCYTGNTAYSGCNAGPSGLS